METRPDLQLENIEQLGSDRLKNFYKRFLEIDETIKQMRNSRVDVDYLGRAKRSLHLATNFRPNLTALDNKDAKSTIDKREATADAQLERKTKCSHVKTESKTHEQTLKHPYYKHSERLDELLDKINDNNIEDANAVHFKHSTSGKDKAWKCSHTTKKMEEIQNVGSNLSQFYKQHINDKFKRLFGVKEDDITPSTTDTTTAKDDSGGGNSLAKRINVDIFVSRFNGISSATEYTRFAEESKANDSDGNPNDVLNLNDSIEVEDKNKANVATLIQSAIEPLSVHTDYYKVPKYSYGPDQSPHSDGTHDHDITTSLPVYPEENIMIRVADMTDRAVKESRQDVDSDDDSNADNMFRMDNYMDISRDFAKVAQAYSDYGVLEDKKAGKLDEKDISFVNKLPNGNRVKCATNQNALNHLTKSDHEKDKSTSPKKSNKVKTDELTRIVIGKPTPSFTPLIPKIAKEKPTNQLFRKRSLLSINKLNSEISEDDAKGPFEKIELDSDKNATQDDHKDKIIKRGALNNIYDEDYGVDYEPKESKSSEKTREYFNMFKKLMAFASNSKKKDKKKTNKKAKNNATPINTTPVIDDNGLTTGEKLLKSPKKSMDSFTNKNYITTSESIFETLNAIDMSNNKYFRQTELNLHSDNSDSRSSYNTNTGNLIDYDLNADANKGNMELNNTDCNTTVTIPTSNFPPVKENKTKSRMHTVDEEKEIISANTFRKENATVFDGKFTNDANRTLVKRSIEVKPVYWNDLFRGDEESGLVEVKAVNGTRQEDLKSERSIRSIGAKLGSAQLHGDNSANSTGVDFRAMTANMKEVFKEAAAEVESTRNIRPAAGGGGGGGTDDVMRSLTALMSELLDLRVEQRTCGKLPPDLMEFLQWLTVGAERATTEWPTPAAEDNAQLGGGADTPEEDVHKRAAASSAARSDKLFAYHAIRDLLGQYGLLEPEERIKMADVSHYLRKQLRSLEKQIALADAVDYPPFRAKRQPRRRNARGDKMAAGGDKMAAGGDNMAARGAGTRARPDGRGEDSGGEQRGSRNLQDVYYRALAESRKMAATHPTSTPRMT